MCCACGYSGCCKLGKFVAEFGALGRALAASRLIFVFLFFVVIVVLIMGTLMYVIEGEGNGFASVHMGVYWAITAMTTSASATSPHRPTSADSSHRS